MKYGEDRRALKYMEKYGEVWSGIDKYGAV